MVNAVATRSIVSFQIPANSAKAVADAALIAAGTQAYTTELGRGKGFAVSTSSEAGVKIQPVSTTGPVSRSSAPSSVAAPAQVSESSRVVQQPSGDQVEISPEIRELMAAGELNEPTTSLRSQRLAQIKAQIEAGTYDTEAKFDAAVERMIDELM